MPMIAMLPLLTALAAAEGRPPPGSWLEGDFRSAEAQITARQRWVRVPALGELLFVEWLDAEGRPLRRRMLRLRQGASGAELELLRFRDAAAFAELDRRPLALAALAPDDLQPLGEGCRLRLAAEGDRFAGSVDPEGCEVPGPEGKPLRLGIELALDAKGLEYAETLIGPEGAPRERLPESGRLRLERIGDSGSAAER